MTKSVAITLAALLFASCGGVGQSAYAGAAATAPSTSQAATAVKYKVVEIPYLSPTSANFFTASCSVAAVNRHGVAVGSCQQACNGCGGAQVNPSERAWMYQERSGALDELIFEPGEASAQATDISNEGIITGSGDAPSGPPEQPVLWTTSGGAVPLTGEFDALTEATAVNAHGTIVGTYTASGAPGSEAVMWSGPNHVQTTLPGLECDHCTVTGLSVNAIDNRGTAVGQSLSNNGLLAVEWRSGTVTSLGSLQNSGTSDAFGINNKGDVVGSSNTKQVGPAGELTHAFLYHQGAMTDLGTLAGDTDSSALSINGKGQIVGTSTNSVNSGRAFLDEDGQMFDLNTLIEPTSPLAGSIKLATAVSISSNGWIAANGTDTRDHLSHAFLLIPVR